MITIYTEGTDDISQKSYDEAIAGLNIRELTCTCGSSRCLIQHGCYKRKIKAPDGVFRLRVNRVKCTACGCTHALLFSSIIPGSQILLKDQLDIIKYSENKSGYVQILKSNLSLDENSVRAVVLRYRRNWQKHVLAGDISVVPVESLIKNCFSTFHKQFMQIKETSNILYIFPT